MNNYLTNNKEIILKYINSSNSNHFSSLWKSIKSNNIKLNRNDIKQMNIQFINYCLNYTNKYNILNKKMKQMKQKKQMNIQMIMKKIILK
jgi:hypothetical protein